MLEQASHEPGAMALAPIILPDEEIGDQRHRFLVRHHARKTDQFSTREQAQPKRVVEEPGNFFRRIMAGPIALLHKRRDLRDVEPRLIIGD
jgi:hypothetical protein